MDSRKLVQKTLEFEKPERIPRQAWVLPWAEKKFPEAVCRLRRDFPDDIISAPLVYTKHSETVGDRYEQGLYTDEWGCVFKNLENGIIGIVKDPLIASWEDLQNFQTPDVVLSLNIETVNSFCRDSDRFVISGAIVRPFERFQFLRTMEQAMVDLAERPPELYELVKQIHEHYLKEVEVWSRTDVDAIALMDDWGVQQGLMVSPNIFREIFKPMYRDYVDIAKQYNKYVFLHSDGYIFDIIPDFIEIGIDAINSQIFCMGIKRLGENFRGRITFWGEIDRQHLLPYGSEQDIDNAVVDIWQALYAGGGVIAQCEFGPGAKPQNVIKVFDSWNKVCMTHK
jgi:hypothetical protein